MSPRARHWHERYPGRLDRERDAFRARGLDFTFDEHELTTTGRVVARGIKEHRGQQIALEVVYPDSFPHLRPEVFAHELDLGRHQHPRDRNLCLLDRSTLEWSVDDTAAWLVDEQLPFLLDKLAAGGRELREAEVPQGEPLSVYVPWYPGTVVFVPAEALELDRRHAAGYCKLRFGTNEPAGVGLRVLLDEIFTKQAGKKRRLARPDEQLRARFGGHELPARWVRVDAPPLTTEIPDYFTAAGEIQPGFEAPHYQPVPGGSVAAMGFVFSTEVQQGVFEDDWIFAVLMQRNGAGRVEGYVTRGQRLTLADLQARVPKLAPLRKRTVAQLGLGGLGAPLALEIARAHVDEVRLLDYDQVELGTTVRWPGGLSAVGHLKPQFLREAIAREYPFVKVKSFTRRLGEIPPLRHPHKHTDYELLGELIDGADLIIDATAEPGITHLVCELAAEAGVAQLVVWGTEGLWGGAVALIRPGITGCWLCLMHHLQDGTIPPLPAEPGGSIQPRGCATRTFTGAGFDLLPLAAQAARMAASHLTGEAPRSADIACMHLHDNNGPLAAPRWTEYPLTIHPQCAACARTS